MHVMEDNQIGPELKNGKGGRGLGICAVEKRKYWQWTKNKILFTELIWLFARNMLRNDPQAERHVTRK